MSVSSTRFFTKALDSSVLAVSATDNVQQASLQVASGTCTVEGDFRFNDQDSGPITLSQGDSLTISGYPQSPIDGLTITAIAGITNIILNF